MSRTRRTGRGGGQRRSGGQTRGRQSDQAGWGGRAGQGERAGRRQSSGRPATLGGEIDGGLDDTSYAAGGARNNAGRGGGARRGGVNGGGSVTPVTGKTFDDQVLFSPIPVVVNYWADWCGPCRMMKPILRELAAAHPEIRFVSVDVMAQKQLADEYRVQAVPTFHVYVRGRQLARFSGAKPKHKLLAQVDAAIKKASG